MNILDGLLGEIEKTAGSDATLFYCCQACGDVYKSASPLAVCPAIACKAEIFQWPGATKEEAQKKAERARTIKANVAEKTGVTAEDSKQTKIDALKEQKAKIAVEREAIKAELTELGVEFNGKLGNAKLKALLEESKGAKVGTIETGPTESSNGVEEVESPDEVEKAATEKETVKVEVQTEVPAKAEKTTVVVTEEEPKETPVETGAEDKDSRAAERKAKISAFVQKYKLSEHAPVPIGSAVIQTVGFTKWVDKQPHHRFMESFETPKSFATIYNTARAEQPTVSIDVARCSHVSNEEIRSILGPFNMVASLIHPQGGTQSVDKKQSVKVGAYKTKKGFIRFVVLDILD